MMTIVVKVCALVAPRSWVNVSMNEFDRACVCFAWALKGGFTSYNNNIDMFRYSCKVLFGDDAPI